MSEQIDKDISGYEVMQAALEAADKLKASAIDHNHMITNLIAALQLAIEQRDERIYGSNQYIYPVAIIEELDAQIIRILEQK